MQFQAEILRLGFSHIKGTSGLYFASCILMAATTMLIKKITRRKKHVSFSNCMFLIYVTLFRQCSASLQKFNMTNMLLGVFALCMSVILTMYENFVTSSIIVPSKLEVLLNFSAVIRSGYKIAALAPSQKAWSDTLETLEEEFVFARISSDKWNSSLHPIWDKVSLTAPELSEILFNKRRHKIAFYLDTGWSSLITAWTISRARLEDENPRVKCFQVTQPLRPVFRGYHFEMFMKGELMRTYQGLIESGCLNFWERYDALRLKFEEQKASNRGGNGGMAKVNNETEQMIGLINLFPLFGLMGIIWLIAILGFYFERRMQIANVVHYY